MSRIFMFVKREGQRGGYSPEAHDTYSPVSLTAPYYFSLSMLTVLAGLEQPKLS